MIPFHISLRSVAITLLIGAVAGCTTAQPVYKAATVPSPYMPPPVHQTATTDPVEMYGAKIDEGFQVAAVDLIKLPADHRRQEVDYQTSEASGTIVVDQKDRYLYLVMPHGKAMRYAVAVGPASRNFTGTAIIDRKAKWPRWIPTASMIQRSPDHYGRYKDGVNGGPGNPMGARALYIQKDGIDTYYRVHGTNDPSSIGKAVSAGCIRLLNQDAIDLYERVNIGAKIVVL